MTNARVTDADIDHIFNVFDVDGSDRISAEELKLSLKAVGWARVSDADVERILPPGRNGLSRSEFRQLVRSKERPLHSMDDVRAAFRLFDFKSRGKINVDDLIRAGTEATQRPVSRDFAIAILRACDKDGDACLNFDEFFAAVSKKLPVGDVPQPADEAEDAQDTEEAETSSAATGSHATSQRRSSITPVLTAVLAPAAQPLSHHALPAVSSGAAGEVEFVEEEVGAAVDAGVTEKIAGVTVTFHDGLITMAAVRAAMLELGYDDATLPDETFKELFDEADEDHDGLLSRHAYCMLLVSLGETVEGF
jgi:Ca2+-binding EF-hand superfamily protein